MNRFELHVAESTVSTGTVSVGWCVPKEVFAALDKAAVKNPQVVLVIAPKENYNILKESRMVVPLKDLLAYVEFRSSGENRIWGFISTRTAKDAKNYLLKSNGEYISTLLNSEGDDLSAVVKGYPTWDDDGTRHEPEDDGTIAEPITVYCPRQCFAAEPSDFEKSWVTWLMTDKSVDQCDFRRKRLFAYTAQLPLFVLFMVLTALLTLASLFIGAKEFSLKPLLHPLTYGFENSLEMISSGTIFYRRGKDSWVKRWALMPLMPAIVFAFAGFMVLIIKAGALYSLFHVILGILGIAVILGVLFVIVGLVINHLEERKLALEAADAWYLDEEEASFMACSPGKRMASLGDLPAKKRTLRLRFLDLKSKVCRPFSV